MCEIETDKTSMPVMSSTNGVLEAISVPDGTTVKAGQELGKITVGGAPSKPAAAAAEAPAPAAAAPAAPGKFEQFITVLKSMIDSSILIR